MRTGVQVPWLQALYWSSFLPCSVSVVTLESWCPRTLPPAQGKSNFYFLNGFFFIVTVKLGDPPKGNLCSTCIPFSYHSTFALNVVPASWEHRVELGEPHKHRHKYTWLRCSSGRNFEGWLNHRDYFRWIKASLSCAQALPPKQTQGRLP